MAGMHTSRSDSPLKINPLRLWLVPTLTTVLVMGALAAMYIGSIAKPAEHLDDFPIAVVNADQPVSSGGQKLDVGGQVSQGLNRQIDHDKFDVQNLTLAQARDRLDEGKLYGAIVLPQGLSRSVSALASAAGKTGTVSRPEVQVLTSPQAGSATVSVVTNLGNTSIQSASQQLGRQLVNNATKQAQQQAQQQARSGGAAASGSSQSGLSGATRLALSDPLAVRTEPYKPLITGSGNGLIPFYYALVLVLAGFTGSLIVSTLMDNDLGIIPAEIGPAYVIRPRSNVSRLQTLLLKWGAMVAVAVISSAVYVGLAKWIGVHLDHPWALWLYGVLTISAVAVVAQAILAMFGSLGMIVNLFVFVILSLPSAGGSMPLEETPTLYRWLGSFEPMHQIYLGTRAILFFDAKGDAGLSRGVIYSFAALLVGLLVGLAVTRTYDVRGFVRSHEKVGTGDARSVAPAGTSPSAAAQPAAPTTRTSPATRTAPTSAASPVPAKAAPGAGSAPSADSGQDAGGSRGVPAGWVTPNGDSPRNQAKA